jgi:hypothetical protein
MRVKGLLALVAFCHVAVFNVRLLAVMLFTPLAAFGLGATNTPGQVLPDKKLPLPGEVFLVEGHAAFIIPAKGDPAARSKPWVWYAPTLPGLPGQEEQRLFEQFINAGIAVAGIDAGESYGGPAGNNLFTAFHATMTGPRGFASKPVLLGRSRGGLMMLSWAVSHPDQVAAFAGIYPVCNLASYPGVATAAAAYGMKPDELQVRLTECNPVDRLAGLAKAGVPLFAIHGDADAVVPLEANSGLVKQRYAALGGTMQVVVPPGQGHNMWPGFFRSQELVDFVIAHAGAKLPVVSPLDGGAIQRVPALGDSLTTNRFKLLFSGAQDVADTWGKLHFGVTPVRLIRECNSPGFTVIGCFPLAGGTWEVFGQEMTEVSRGNQPYDRIMAFKLIRALTRDGAKFESWPAVLEPKAAAWTDHAAVAYNPDRKEYLLLKLRVDRSGFAYTAFFSSDALQWQEHPGNPLFYDGDSMSLFWSPVLHRFVCVNKSLQPYRKHLVDHGGATPRLQDDALRDRRVLMIRSSADGRRWEPSVSLADVWNRDGRKDAIASEWLTVPDANDPPDLEFYSGNAFWYHDRAYMTVLNYAASPLSPRQHGPQLDNEWWTSRDGLHWERPARGANALELFPQVPRLETHPLIIHGTILFPRGQLLLGLPEDRISFVGARANGEFSTKSFTMPAAELLLNAASPAPDRSFANDQAYVMVAVQDEYGSVLPGFEAEKCVVRNQDGCDIPLKWGTLSARQLAGRTIRLRFFLRSANIYAVSAGGVVRELIRDRHFQEGFRLVDPQPGRRLIYGRLAGMATNTEPVWDLDQWSSRFPLAAEPPQLPEAGVRRWANPGKGVTWGQPGLAEADLSLGVNAITEYGERARKSGEPWVHLLVEQSFVDPPALSGLVSARLRLKARLLHSQVHRTADYSPGLHAAQFQLFLMLQNRNRQSAGYGKLLWFGIPLYDDRARFPKEHKQQDTGGTAMFIFTPGGEVFSDRSAHERQWITVDTELRPLMLESLETAWERGFLRESRDLADYRITGMNLGWEVPGLFDVEMQVRNLSLRVREEP